MEAGRADNEGDDTVASESCCTVSARGGEGTVGAARAKRAKVEVDEHAGGVGEDELVGLAGVVAEPMPVRRTCVSQGASEDTRGESGL